MENKVYKLKKALYNLKQSSRAWYTSIDSYLIDIGFLRCPYKHTLYVKFNPGRDVIVCLYMDAFNFYRQQFQINF